MLARERVANVRKHWVRLVTACNSRCVFCLDTDTPRNVYIPEDDVRRELERGREQLHADKVILSGGEGSIHPKFVDFVRYAKEIGYNRVQTVTNGVMFSKREFYHARRRGRARRDHLQPARPHAGAARSPDRHARAPSTS